jgi:hypothetical protein
MTIDVPSAMSTCSPIRNGVVLCIDSLIAPASPIAASLASVALNARPKSAATRRTAHAIASIGAAIAPTTTGSGHTAPRVRALAATQTTNVASSTSSASTTVPTTTSGAG